VRFSVFLTPTDLGEVQNINPRVCPNDCRSYVTTTCACIRYANVCMIRQRQRNSGRSFNNECVSGVFCGSRLHKAGLAVSVCGHTLTLFPVACSLVEVMINAGSLVEVFSTAGGKICSLTVSMDQQGAEGRRLLSAILLIVPPAAEIVVIDQAGMQINQKIHDDQQWADQSGTTILTVVCRRSAPTSGKISVFRGDDRCEELEYFRDFKPMSAEVDPNKVMNVVPKYFHDIFVGDSPEAPAGFVLQHAPSLISNWPIVVGAPVKMRVQPSWLELQWCNKCFVAATALSCAINCFIDNDEDAYLCLECQKDDPSLEILCICSYCELPIRELDTEEANCRPQTVELPEGFTDEDNYGELYCQDCSFRHGTDWAGC
jgi:hypothetical protein